MRARQRANARRYSQTWVTKSKQKAVKCKWDAGSALTDVGAMTDCVRPDIPPVASVAICSKDGANKMTPLNRNANATIETKKDE